MLFQAQTLSAAETPQVPLGTAKTIQSSEHNLSFSASDVRLRKDATRAYFIENIASSNTALVHTFIIPDGTEDQSYQISHAISANALNERERVLFLAGNSGDKGIVSALKLSSGEVSSVVFDAPFVAPSIAVDAQGIAYLADINSPDIQVLSPEDFSPAKDGLEILKANGQTRHASQSVLLPRYVAVSELAVSEDGSLFFVSNSSYASVFVIQNGEKSAVLNKLDYTSTKGGPVIPLALSVRTIKSSRSKSGSTSSLIIGDAERGRIVLSDLNRIFSKLDIIADVDVTVDYEKSIVEYDSIRIENGSSIIKNPLLIAPSDGQEAIVVGTRGARRLSIYGRQGATLQKFSDVTLSGPVREVEVSHKGFTAVALIDGTSFAILSSGSIEGADSTVLLESKTGDKDIRDLQLLLNKLGFPVGAVDGMIGDKTSRTSRALKAVIARYGLKSDPNDVIAIIGELNGLKSAD